MTTDVCRALEERWERIQRLPPHERQVGAVLFVAVSADVLSPEESAAFWERRSGALAMALWDSTTRSGVFEMRRAAQVGTILKALELVDDDSGAWVETATGRKVSTRLRELGRLALDWTSPEARVFLESFWSQLSEMSLPQLKDWVRQHNPNRRPEEEDAHAVQDADDGLALEAGR